MALSAVFLLFGKETTAKMNYRNRMREQRKTHALTQADIGKVLQRTQQGYNHIETGRAELKIEDLICLCRLYGVSADYMLGLSDEPSHDG